MHPLVFAEFDAICRQHLQGGAVLEVGATKEEGVKLRYQLLTGKEGMK